ncbi:hypothetical protein BT96DRAFT_1065770 [Gymnopus androsaceus JB14]|uniref:Uncharacterized protein n=1 Tax=Gymnopus androsaceus JB14 TaxID=1447944 RepID=A0A6A4I8L4_9AGAR|nr:hypothetical protein BT96DRAFT_1065770 [Gymnopus androsaceus JB14]
MPPKKKALQKNASNATPRNTRSNTNAASHSGTKRSASSEPAAVEKPATKRGRKDATQASTAKDKTGDGGEEAPQLPATTAAPSKRKSVKLSGPSTVETTPTSNSSSILSGKFDIYAMELSFLSKVYLAKGSSNPQYEELYKTILTYQAKPDSTAQCVIPDLSTSSSKSGSLTSAVLCDPMSDERYDIGIESLKSMEKISYTATQRKQVCIVGNLRLREGGCGIASSEGDFRMSRVWTKEENGKLIELFEGILSLRITHSGLYQRKGHGSGMALSIPFWAVRARKDSTGKEIGPECEDDHCGGHWVDYGNDSFTMNEGGYGDGYDSESDNDGMGYDYDKEIYGIYEDDDDEDDDEDYY